MSFSKNILPVLILISLLALQACRSNKDAPGDKKTIKNGKKFRTEIYDAKQAKIERSEDNVFWQQPEKSWADSVLQSMTLDQKIGQLMMVAAYSNRDKKHIQELDTLIMRYGIGGLIFFQGGPLRQAAMTNHFQSITKVPLFISIDGEWGLSMRLDSTIQYPKQMTLGAIQNDSLIYLMGRRIGWECKRLGMQINFAPVLDINNNPKNPVIGNRSFGESKFMVAQKGMAYMEGMQYHHVLANGKHFPGHGDTDTDSHLALPRVVAKVERIDSLELYPFRMLMRKGLKSVMVAHLEVPCLDTSKNCAASISHTIVRKLLRDSLNYHGLVFTDALNMKGVANFFKPGELEVRALFAGNDVLLFPEDVPTAVSSIKQAIQEGLLSENEINEHARRILIAKSWAGLQKPVMVDTSNLIEDLNNQYATTFSQSLYAEALTLLSNKNGVLPLKRLDTLRLASLTIGEKGPASFKSTVELYTGVDHYTFKPGAPKALRDSLLSRLFTHNLVLVSVETGTRKPDGNFGFSEEIMQFIRQLMRGTKVVLNLPLKPYALNRFEGADSLEALIMPYENTIYTGKLSASLVFGAATARGRLPVSVNGFPMGSGILIDQTCRMSYTEPESIGISDSSLKPIEKLIQDAIKQKALPGAQVLAAYDGKVFYHQSFVKPFYEGKQKSDNKLLYDLASITKVAATTLMSMRLVDSGQLDTEKPLSLYLSEAKAGAKANMPIRDFFLHRSGLKPFIPFYESTLKKGKPSKKFYRDEFSLKFPIQVTDSLYLHKGWNDSLLNRVLRSETTTPGKMVYSDMGFYILKAVNEKLVKQSQHDFLMPIYAQLGASSMGYLPLLRNPVENIAPTEKDKTFRKTLIHGYVHDPGAAMMGGVAGHAGLFSNANDLAKVFQMLMWKGTYGGEQYLRPETVQRFTQKVMNDGSNRRGLGFDKAETDTTKASPCAASCSASTFGHTGFTGTAVWADPGKKLLFVFLSNRVHPDAENKKILELSLRTKVQEQFYKAVEQRRPDGKMPKGIY